MVSEDLCITVRKIIPAVPVLGKGPPNIGRENLYKILLYENKIHLGVHPSLLVQKIMIFCLFCSVFPRIGTMSLDLNTLASTPYEFIVSPKHWD